MSTARTRRCAPSRRKSRPSSASRRQAAVAVQPLEGGDVGRELGGGGRRRGGAEDRQGQAAFGPGPDRGRSDDPAAQAAIRRDSGGTRLPVVFIAGDCVGGRVELVNLAASGELKRRVFGA
jgi:hypothetical protein